MSNTPMMEVSEAMGQDKCTQIRVTPETREKLDAIAALKRWKLGTTVDALADAFAEREGIQLPKPAPVRRAHRQTA